MTENPRLSPNAFAGTCGIDIRSRRLAGVGLPHIPLWALVVLNINRKIYYVDIDSTKYETGREERYQASPNRSKNQSNSLYETSSFRTSNYVSLFLRLRRPFKASVSPSSFEHRSLQSSLSFRTFSNSASRSFIRSTRLCRHLRAASVLSLRFSTRDESTRLKASSP